MTLAEILRPNHIDDIVGQQHLVGENKPLRTFVQTGQLHSMILWGPPGVGKTSLARILSQSVDCEWIALSAVFSGVRDIRAAVAQAEAAQKKGRKTILFIDEIHRFNKTQQDALLPYTESGLLIFIGATTENPSFEVNPALLSRAQVYVLKSLEDSELRQLFVKAQQHILQQLTFEEAAIESVIGYADGDARRLFHVLEQIGLVAKVEGLSYIDNTLLSHQLGHMHKRFDKNGDLFYEQISALHKSVRGSNPDAALYWLCRMLDGGVDPHYLARRMIRMSWEDIGLADPRAIQIAQDAAATYDRLGSPEGELALAEAVIYLAVAAKSNAGYAAFNKAMDFVRKDKSREVPIHLRNASSQFMKNLGYGKNYRYAHEEPYAYAPGEKYFPDGMPIPQWYQPTNRGLEIKIAEKMAFLQKLEASRSPSDP